MFTFDFSLLVKRLLPPFLRKQIMVAWATVLLTPMANVWAELVAYYAQIIAYTSLYPGTFALQYELRLRYPNVSGYRVYIHTKYDDYPTTYCSYVGEHHLEETVVFYDSEGTHNDVPVWYEQETILKEEYVVIVPTFYSANALDIENFLNQYRPAGRRYILEFTDII
jgi:hypothetical protein